MFFLSNKSMSHKFVVIDEIMEQMEAAKSGIVPGSVTQAVVSGIQNVPANIKQQSIGGVSSTSYTTFPLSPIVKNCCLDKSYLNFEFDVSYTIEAEVESDGKNVSIPYYIGFRDTASMFDQLQILIENSAIWTTIYQREESVLSYNSLPETEIRGNNQYASIEKMREGKYCPMKRVITTTTISSTTVGTKHICKGEETIHFKATVDLNRLTPLLSNLHFTTPHMGNLRLKVFMQQIEKALFFCPDYNYISQYAKNITKPTAGANYNQAAVQAIFDKLTNEINTPLQPFSNQYWQFYPLYMLTEGVKADTIPFYAVDSDNNLIVLKSVKMSNHSSEPFFTFEGSGIAEIVQTCFDIKDEEYQRLTDYFASLGSVIIPSQVWSTSVFNNSTITKGNGLPKTQIGNIGGYNIDFISVWTHPTQSSTTFANEFLTDIQLILDGRPINALPYAYVNDKCVVDTTQAIIDTDHEEINHDYITSLTQFNLNDDKTYTDDPLSTVYGNGDMKSSINKNYIANPNTYCLNFSTNLPDAFHSGACILENSNRQAVLRYNAQSRADAGPGTTLNDTSKFPLVINHKNTDVVSGFSAFCDCCIVLTYDPARQTCFDGQLSWAAPYA